MLQARPCHPRPSRAAALAALSCLAAAAGDDYLPLLPDALPFLGELLEDPSPAVSARAAAAVSGLEAAAGESLAQYLRP